MSPRSHTVCDIRQLPTVADLTVWAGKHGVRVRYIGPTLEGHAVYEATQGHATRVAVDTTEEAPCPMPLSWESPLATLTAPVPAPRRHT